MDTLTGLRPPTRMHRAPGVGPYILSGMDPEREALAQLVRSAGGRATIEPTTMLALAVLSPWSGDRRDFLDRPNRIAPQMDARGLLSFLDEIRPMLSDRRLPTGRGFLAWMRFRGLAVPVGELTKIPSWLTDPTLADGWICLPPAAGYRQAQPDTDVIEVDGRVAALHLLITQAADSAEPTGVPRDAVTRILDWFAGPHAAHWSSAAGDQCTRMRLSLQNAGHKAWFQSFDAAPVEPIREIITRAVPLVSESWRKPPPTPAELAAEAERQRIIAEGEAQLKAWQERGRRVPSA